MQEAEQAVRPALATLAKKQAVGVAAAAERDVEDGEVQHDVKPTATGEAAVGRKGARDARGLCERAGSIVGYRRDAAVSPQPLGDSTARPCQRTRDGLLRNAKLYGDLLLRLAVDEPGAKDMHLPFSQLVQDVTHQPHYPINR